MQTTVSTKFKTVDEYIAAFPVKTKKILKELRQTIKAAAPQAQELISYNMPAFKLEGMLIWYAAWKEHISIYPRTKEMEATIKELSAYEGAKGTIKFPLDEPLPFDLISKIVRFRIQENLEVAKTKMKKKIKNEG